MRTVAILVGAGELLVELHRLPGIPGVELALVGDKAFALVQTQKRGARARVVVVGVHGGVAVGSAHRVAALLNFVWGCCVWGDPAHWAGHQRSIPR